MYGVVYKIGGTRVVGWWGGGKRDEISRLVLVEVEVGPLSDTTDSIDSHASVMKR